MNKKESAPPGNRVERVTADAMLSAPMPPGWERTERVDECAVGGQWYRRFRF